MKVNMKVTGGRYDQSLAVKCVNVNQLVPTP